MVVHRVRPSLMNDGGKVAVIRMPQRPDERMEVLGTFGSSEEATAWLNEHFPAE
ncbi:hypothetical protein WQE_22798 [Paraburkholderia hospita]|uniref:Uncharacterized protein n=1 Tax=Paraburkholderia hospita TaxID=169430 RepID=A0ABP2PMG8_9BURK|nr:hypothetical protein WQE_22798 [Paraburkholderia hospita]